MPTSTRVRHIVDGLLLLYACIGVTTIFSLEKYGKEYGITTLQENAYFFVAIYPICCAVQRFLWNICVQNNSKNMIKFGTVITCIYATFYVIAYMFFISL